MMWCESVATEAPCCCWCAKRCRAVSQTSLFLAALGSFLFPLWPPPGPSFHPINPSSKWKYPPGKTQILATRLAGPLFKSVEILISPNPFYEPKTLIGQVSRTHWYRCWSWWYPAPDPWKQARAGKSDAMTKFDILWHLAAVAIHY